MSKTKTITITIKGNSFGDQYAKDGQRNYYSKWKITLRQNRFGGISQNILLIDCNMDAPKDMKKEYEKLDEYQNICNNGF